MTLKENKFREQIRKQPLFVGLKKAQFDETLARCVLKHYKKNEKVLYSKAPREGLLLILNGVAEVFVAADNFNYRHHFNHQPKQYSLEGGPGGSANR